MFLSLVRPERISSPITSSAAVTGSLGADEFAVVMAARLLAARRSGPSLPCHCALSCFKSSAGGAAPGEANPPGAPGAGGEETDARTGAATPDRLRAPTHRLRSGPQRRFALPLERALGPPQSELGAPFPCS